MSNKADKEKTLMIWNWLHFIGGCIMIVGVLTLMIAIAIPADIYGKLKKK